MSDKSEWRKMSWVKFNQCLANWSTTIALMATCALLLMFLMPDIQPSRQQIIKTSYDQLNKIGNKLNSIRSRPSAKKMAQASQQALCKASSPNYWKNVDPLKMTAEEMMDYMRWTNSTSCRIAHDFGGGWIDHKSSKSKVAGLDGQKAVCLDEGIVPPTNRCVVYSFGINYDSSFDDLMEKFGCQVFSFDPSMTNGTHNRSANVHFFKLGLMAAMSADGQFQSMDYIYEMLKPYHGENAIIDYLKMDIESSEWTVLPQMMKSGMMKRVRQLGVEFHMLPFDQPLRHYQEQMAIIKSLEDYGMVRFDSKMNPWGMYKIDALNPDRPVVACYEIAWYNSNLINVK